MTHASPELPEHVGEPGPVAPPSDPGPFQPEQTGVSRPLTDRLRERFGSGSDPGIALEPPAPAEFPSSLLDRLAGHQSSIGRYQLQSEIAKGGQGVVLRVWDEDLRRHLAMKVMLGKCEAAPGQTPQVDPRSLGRFLEEAQVTGQLDHPGIVPVHELGLDAQGRVFFTMKLVKGRTLKEVFDLVARCEEGWTQTRVLGVLLRVCEAMAYAHHKGVVHRDLKPANVMVGRFGEVYVMDWGLAKVLGHADQKDVRISPEMTAELVTERHDRAGRPSDALMTMDGHVVGTPAYMSPEQALGDLGAMGPHSDVYSVGAMLYHLLAGHMPFVKPGSLPSNYAIWYRLQEGPPEPLHQVAGKAPAELVAICEKAMARDRHLRYQDMSELAEDLRALLEHRVVRAHETGAVAEFRKWVVRNRALASTAIGAALLILVGSVGTSILFKSQRDVLKVVSEKARENEKKATEEAEKVQREQTKVLRLSALHELNDLTALADSADYRPPYPDKIKLYEDWLNG
jgi:serine/threonine-protein kinase